MSSTRLVALDSLVAVVAAVLGVFAIENPPGPEFGGPWWVAWIAAGVVGLPVAVRRRWPVPVLVAVLLATAASTVLGAVGAGAIWVAWVPVALGLYLVALTTTWRGSLIGGLTCLLAASAVIGVFYRTVLPELTPTPEISEAPLYWRVEAGTVGVALVAAFTLGRIMRWRRAVAARFADQLAREAVGQERLRIARDLHDVVGHSMSLIAVKATIANHVAQTRPDEVRAALRIIERTSQESLSEIRQVLGALRTASEPPPELMPVPGLARLGELCEDAEGAGVTVELTIREPVAVPAAIGMSAYRIVQEALTNVVRHAAPTRCAVAVEACPEEVRVEVTDEGPEHPERAPAHGDGHGLLGMRERAVMYGGSFSAGPRPEGGFRVSASLPCNLWRAAS